jgi:enoyl-CoA hydratase/carnithine racemase
MAIPQGYIDCQVDADGIALLELTRPAKHNAINDGFIAALDAFFSAPPADAKVIVIHTRGEHFCAGLDLSEHKERTPFEVMRHSQSWHRAFERIAQGGLPVVAAMTGAVIGGGLELAMATHVRVAEPSTFYQLPEGKRGIFVGGGASVRVARAIGAGRMTEMMLTGRRYDASEGLALGLAHYVVEAGQALPRAIELARTIASNAPLSNYAMLTAIGRIDDMSSSDGLYTESLVAALVQTSDEAKKGINAFLERKKQA